MTDHPSQWNGSQQTETSRKPIRTLAEFLERQKAGHRARGLDDSLITELKETTDSSGTMRYGVIFNPRRPRPKNDNQKEV